MKSNSVALSDTQYHLGTVKWFGGFNRKDNRENDFGFISSKQFGDVFVHTKTLQNASILREDQRVLFTQKAGKKGASTVRVYVLTGLNGSLSELVQPLTTFLIQNDSLFLGLHSSGISGFLREVLNSEPYAGELIGKLLQSNIPTNHLINLVSISEQKSTLLRSHFLSENDLFTNLNTYGHISLLPAYIKELMDDNPTATMQEIAKFLSQGDNLSEALKKPDVVFVLKDMCNNQKYSIEFVNTLYKLEIPSVSIIKLITLWNRKNFLFRACFLNKNTFSENLEIFSLKEVPYEYIEEFLEQSTSETIKILTNYLCKEENFSESLKNSVAANVLRDVCDSEKYSVQFVDALCESGISTAFIIKLITLSGRKNILFRECFLNKNTFSENLNVFSLKVIPYNYIEESLGKNASDTVDSLAHYLCQEDNFAEALKHQNTYDEHSLKRICNNEKYSIELVNALYRMKASTASIIKLIALSNRKDIIFRECFLNRNVFSENLSIFSLKAIPYSYVEEILEKNPAKTVESLAHYLCKDKNFSDALTNPHEVYVLKGICNNEKHSIEFVNFLCRLGASTTSIIKLIKLSNRKDILFRECFLNKNTFSKNLSAFGLKAISYNYIEDVLEERPSESIETLADFLCQDDSLDKILTDEYSLRTLTNICNSADYADVFIKKLREFETPLIPITRMIEKSHRKNSLYKACGLKGKDFSITSVSRLLTSECIDENVQGLAEYIGTLSHKERIQYLTDAGDHISFSAFLYLLFHGLAPRPLKEYQRNSPHTYYSRMHSDTLVDFVKGIVLKKKADVKEFVRAAYNDCFKSFDQFCSHSEIFPVITPLLVKRKIYIKDMTFIADVRDNPSLLNDPELWLLSVSIPLVHAKNNQDDMEKVILHEVWQALLSGHIDVNHPSLFKLFPQCESLKCDYPHMRLSCEAFHWKPKDSDEKYLCRSRICHKPEVIPNLNKSYFDYSAFDWLAHYGINYAEEQKPTKKDFSIKLAGYINRIRELHSRLHCRCCQQLMVPNMKYARVQVTTFDPSTGERVTTPVHAAYRLTVFACNNSACQEYERSYYINHCIHYKCHEIIDSRDLTEKCSEGRYYCPECHSCCPTHTSNNTSPAERYGNRTQKHKRLYQSSPSFNESPHGF